MTSVSSFEYRLRFRVDREKSVLINNFERRGWSRAYEDDWNIYWASPHTVKMIFNPENNIRLHDQQLINHFPNHYELTRKDLMVKNLKRYRKELERVHSERIAEANAGGGGGASSGLSSELDFEHIPTTFILPADFSLFVDEFRKNPHTMWIMKPTSKSQGVGIFIINRLSQVKRWARAHEKEMGGQATAGRDAYVISRYIDAPLLVGGKKFDLRIYVLVLSYRPLRVYSYRRGFARFCTFKYTNEASELDNEMVHLTNVAIQKNSDGYSHSHGFKWSLKNLRAYIEGTRGLEAAEKLMEDIGWLIVHSLKAVQNVMIHDKHCFECYGYDVMIDTALKPWLLEVNASPSLSTTTAADKLLKTQLISELLDLVVPHRFGDDGAGAGAGGARGPARDNAGNFELLFDESVEIEAEKARREAEARRQNKWKPDYARSTRAPHGPRAT